MKKIFTVCLLVAAAACAGGAGQDDGRATAETAGLPDDQVGLSKVSVFDVPTPEPVQENELMPGEGPLQARAYDTSPPVVPHAMADFLPMTRDDNACLLCHMVAEQVEGEATPMPESHYTDLRHTPDKVGDEVAGARYNCTLCHVSRTDAVPLVANEFNGR